MDRSKSKTVDSYNLNAKKYISESDERGARIADIELIFSYLGSKTNPFVVELGCAQGRDALEIIKHTNNYIGMDASTELIKEARNRLPGYKFIVSDFAQFKFPRSVDAIVAFASLLHADKETLRALISRAFEALNSKGIIFLSMQEGEYKEHIKEDELGTRTFYYYTPNDILNLMPKGCQSLRVDKQDIRGKKWFSMILTKI